MIELPETEVIAASVSFLTNEYDIMRIYQVESVVSICGQEKS